MPKTEIEIDQIFPGTANQLIGANNAATKNEYKTLSGTSNEVIVTNGVGSITLSTPQAIATTSSVQFQQITLGSTTLGGVIFNDTEGTPKTVALEAPSTITSSYTLKLPGAQGGSNNVLVNDGSGNLSFTASLVISTLSTTSTTVFQAGASIDNSYAMTFYSIGGGYINLQAPTSAVSSYTLKLPTAQGTANYFLQNDGSGNLSWQQGGGVGYREDYVVGTPLNNYTGSTTVFNLVNSYNVGGHTLIVTEDGVVMTIGAGNDYLETNSTTVTFNNTLDIGETVSFIFSQPPTSTSGIVNSGTTGQIAYYASGGTTLSGKSVLPIANGGTGQTTYTDGQLLIDDSSTNVLDKATITGTTNQVIVTNGHGSITLSLPQSIATSSTPTFASETLNSGATPLTDQLNIQANGAGNIGFLNYSTDNERLMLDCHYNSGVIADYTSAYQIIKGAGTLLFTGDNGLTISNSFSPTTRMTLSTSSLTMAVPIAMGSNKITSLASGTATTDAATFGQMNNVAGPSNILFNGGMELWPYGTSFSNPWTSSAVTASNWATYSATANPTGTVTQEPNTVHDGGYSLRLHITAVNGCTQCIVFQNIDNYAEFRGLTITLSVWVDSNTATTVAISDSVNPTSTSSAYNTGIGGWQQLTVSHAVSSSTTFLQILLAAQTPTVSDQYFDSAMLVIGSIETNYEPTTPLSSSGAFIVGQNGPNGIILGTNTNDSPSTGYVGEHAYASSVLANVGTSGQFTNVTSIVLTAGDWDVSGQLFLSQNGATLSPTSQVLSIYVSAYSGNTTTDQVYGDNSNVMIINALIGDSNTGIVSNWRVSIASTTTIYLKGAVSYTSGTPLWTGRISARRVR